MGSHQPLTTRRSQRVHNLLIVNKNIAVGWVARAAVLLLAFVNTRLLIDCAGAEGLAAYSIIISLTPWLALMNLGLPITIQNAISRLRGSNQDYIVMRDQAFGTMIIVALALAPASMLVGWLVYKYLMVNYTFTTPGAVIGVCFLIYITSVCQLLTHVMYAEYEAFWPNIYPAFVPIWTTVVLIISRGNFVDDFNLLFVLIGLANLLMPIHAAWHLKIFKKAKFNLNVAIQQIVASKDQFLFAAMAAITLSIDYLVMSRTLGALDIVNYNLVSRLFLTLLVIHGVLIATNWTSVSDLIHASRKQEARRKVENLLKQGLLLGVGVGFLIYVSIDPVVKILTGGKVEEVPLELGLAFWFYVLLRIWTDTYAMALQGYGLVSEINKFIPIQAFISAVGQYFLGVNFGATGVVVALIFSFVLTASWIIPKKFYSITKK